MLERELTYLVQSKRTRKLASRAYVKQAPRVIWYWVASFFGLGAATALLLNFDDRVQQFHAQFGLPWISSFAALILAFWVLHAYLGRRIDATAGHIADREAEQRLRWAPSGLQFITDELETVLKWQGIQLIYLEPDGVVLAIRDSCFFVPDSAFRDDAERANFVAAVLQRLDVAAQARSEPLVRRLLSRPATTVGGQ